MNAAREIVDRVEKAIRANRHCTTEVQARAAIEVVQKFIGEHLPKDAEFAAAVDLLEDHLR